MLGGISFKLYLVSVFFLLGSILIPYFYVNFVAQPTLAYDFQLAPELESIYRDENVLILNTTSYKTIFSEPRKHAAVVALIAVEPQYRCGNCKTVKTYLKNLAQSWLKQNSEYPLFFSYLDVSEGYPIFRKLNIEHVPLILLYLPQAGKFAIPTGSESESNFMKSAPESLGPESLADWISNTTKQPFNYKQPPNLYLFLVTSLLGSIALVSIRWVLPLIYTILSSRAIWLGTSVVFISLMTSGFMWNQIRHPPFASADRNGQPILIYPQYSQQFEAETYIVMFLHFICAICTIALAALVPKCSPRVQNVLSIGLLGTILVVYSGLIRVFRIKNRDYPFNLF